MRPLHIDDPAAGDVDTAGAKAATLSLLRREGFDVPDAWVLPVSLTTAIAAAPERAAAAVDQVLSQLGETLVAVRSSGVAEDAPSASFAGMYDTFLDVSGPAAVTEAVIACIGAASSSRLSAYRGREDVAVPAVLIQRMVAADCAGVAFSIDPVTGASEVRVSAVKGLGEALVSGRADPEEWVVDRSTLSARCPDDRGVLGAGLVERIAILTLKLEEHFGRPQDVEWAAVDDRVELLQARPITVIPKPPGVVLPGTGWAKDTSHYPEQLSPLGASIYDRLIRTATLDMVETYGLLIKRLDQRTIGGEVYVRAEPIAGPVGSKGRRAPPALLIGLLARVIPVVRRATRRAELALDSQRLETVFDRWDQEWGPYFRAETRRLQEIAPAGLDDALLLRHYEEIDKVQLEGMRVHFLLFLPYAVAMAELDQVCTEHLGWNPSKALELLTGLSRASVEGRDALAEVAKKVADTAGAAEALAANPDDPVTALASVDRAMAEDLSAWLSSYGWRCFNYDAGSPAWAERPDLVARMLVDGLSASPDGARQREAAVAEARSRLSGAALALFESRLTAAMRAYPNREENVVYADQGGLIRRWALEAAKRLVDRGILERSDDVVWLEAEEVVESLRHTPAPDLTDRLVERKSEYAWVRAHPGPTHIGEPDAVPDLSKLPAALRRTNGALLWVMTHDSPPDLAYDLGDAIAVGNPACAGTATGPVRIVMGEADFHKVRPGDVMVSPVTTPAWTMLYSLVGAVVTDHGGVLSHAAIVAREHGIPAVIGALGATTTLRDGQIVIVDGTTGRVYAAQ